MNDLMRGPIEALIWADKIVEKEIALNWSSKKIKSEIEEALDELQTAVATHFREGLNLL
ncbi:MAG: hypothetical protein NTX81_01445 [Candidatus Bathyarchaeota archaeon]|jgi:hypothetical protein|nr:hypothetical protein [Candidatus Bathyarchaeota archaeon]